MVLKRLRTLIVIEAIMGALSVSTLIGAVRSFGSVDYTEYILPVEDIEQTGGQTQEVAGPEEIEAEEVDEIETEETNYTEEEIELMARVVHAEAGNQDPIGKRLVADVIINRVNSDSFPSTVYEVAMQKSQFAVSDEYTDEDMDAVLQEIPEQMDTEILYFRTGKYHGFGTPAYIHGAHYFSKGGK